MNRNLTIVLVIVFVVLLLYVLLIQRPAQEAQANATPTPAAVVSTSGALWEGLTADQILSVTITEPAAASNAARTVAFGRPDTAGAWAITAPNSEPADQLLAAQNAASVANLRFTNTITTATDLTPFGLTNPAYQIQIALADGSSKQLLVGEKAPIGSAYYAQRGTEATVLVIDSFSLETLFGLLENPPVLAPTPDPSLTPALTPTP